MKQRGTENLLAICLVIMTSACSVAYKSKLPVNHDLGPIAAGTTNNIPVTLEAPVWLWDDRIRYRLLYDDATVIHYYHLDRWEAPLPALLERQLTFSRKRQPIKLQVLLTQFEQQFKTASHTQVAMGLTVSAFSDSDYRLLGTRSFSLSQKTKSADAAGAIAGFITVIKQAKAGIAIWLETVPGPDKQMSADDLNQ